MEVSVATHEELSILRLFAKDSLLQHFGHYVQHMTLENWELLVEQQINIITPSQLAEAMRMYE